MNGQEDPRLSILFALELVMAYTHQLQGPWCQSTGSQCCCSKCPDSPRWFPGNQFRLQGLPRYYASELRPAAELSPSRVLSRDSRMLLSHWDFKDNKNNNTLHYILRKYQDFSFTNAIRKSYWLHYVTWWYIYISSTDRLPHQIDILIIKRPRRKHCC